MPVRIGKPCGFIVVDRDGKPADSVLCYTEAEAVIECAAWNYGNHATKPFGFAPVFLVPPADAGTTDGAPWTLRDALAKLVEAAELLLGRCNYDGHGHEEIAAALGRGRAYLREVGPRPEGFHRASPAAGTPDTEREAHVHRVVRELMEQWAIGTEHTSAEWERIVRCVLRAERNVSAFAALLASPRPSSGPTPPEGTS